MQKPLDLEAKGPLVEARMGSRDHQLAADGAPGRPCEGAGEAARLVDSGFGGLVAFRFGLLALWPFMKLHPKPYKPLSPEAPKPLNP